MTIPGAGIAAKAAFRVAKGVGKAASRIAKDIKKGKEYVPFGSRNTFRVAPWGNRTGHRTGKYPHYHRRKTDSRGRVVPGGSIKRHRPWDTKQTDTSFWNRF